MEFFELKPGHVVRLGSVIGVEVLLNGAYKRSGPHLNVILTQGGETYSMMVDFPSREETQTAAENLCEKLFQAEGQACLARESDRRDLFAAAALEGLLARESWTADALLTCVLDISRSVTATLNANMPVRFRDGCSEY